MTAREIGALAQIPPKCYIMTQCLVLEREVIDAAVDALERAKLYWEGREFCDWWTTDKGWEANRGSLMGNLSSFDVCKLRTHLQLEQTAVGVQAALTVDVGQQIITIWNYAKLQLELREFDLFIRTGNYDIEAWESYRRLQWRVYLDWRPAPGLVKAAFRS